MQPVSSTPSTTSVTYSRTQTANRSTTEPVPDATNTEPADLRSRLEGGEALQKRAEPAGVEPTESGPESADIAAVGLGVGGPAPVGPGLIHRAAPPAPATPGAQVGGPSGRDAARSIDDLATSMAVDTATIRQSIDNGSLSQLLAQNGVQSSIGMLFNTRL